MGIRWHKFSPDIQLDILKRMPLKTLGRCMCTCKSMLATITSPALRVSKPYRPHGFNGKSPYHLYSYISEGCQKFFISQDFDCFDDDLILDSPVDSTFFLVGYCDGLVCFTNSLDPSPSIVLWNPSLGKNFSIPMAPLPLTQRSHELGFGFDQSSLDYKVVRVGILPSCYSDRIWADVFAVPAVTWKRVVGSISRPVSKIIGGGIYVDGVIHWIVRLCSSDGKEDQYSMGILTFDLAKEVFGEIDICDEAYNPMMTLTTLTMSGEQKLVVYHMDHICSVWIMEEYGVADSWKKLCAIDVGGQDDDYGKVLYARSTGIIYVVTTKEEKLIGYDVQTQEQYDVRPINHRSQLQYVGPYVQSLIFPGLYQGTISSKRIRLKGDEEEKWDVETPKRRRETWIEDTVDQLVFPDFPIPDFPDIPIPDIPGLPAMMMSFQEFHNQLLAHLDGGNAGRGNAGRGNAGGGNIFHNHFPAHVGGGNVGGGNAGGGNAGGGNAGHGNAGGENIFHNNLPGHVGGGNAGHGNAGGGNAGRGNAGGGNIFLNHLPAHVGGGNAGRGNIFHNNLPAHVGGGNAGHGNVGRGNAGGGNFFLNHLPAHVGGGNAGRGNVGRGNIFHNHLPAHVGGGNAGRGNAGRGNFFLPPGMLNNAGHGFIGDLFGAAAGFGGEFGGGN